MYFVLALCGGILGLFVTGAAVFTIWSVMDTARKRKQDNGSGGHTAQATELADALRRWTVMDYASLFIFVIGALLLLSDLFAVARDRASYPFYHYGYLFAAFIFMTVGMLVIVLRLAIVLRTPSSSYSPADNQLSEPSKTDETEQRVQGGEQRFEPDVADSVAEQKQ